MESVTPKPAVVPRMRIGISVALQILSMLLILGPINYLSFLHYARLDFSRSQKFSMSTQTRRVIGQLKTPVKIIVFFSPTSVTADAQLFPDVQSLLKEYQFSGRDKIQLEFVDPARDPSRARDLELQYKFSAQENLIIIDYEGRNKVIPIADLANFDLSGIQNGEPARVTAFKGEQVLTGALISLIDLKKHVAYFLTGHGEPSIEGMTQLSVLRDTVERLNVHIATLDLSSTDKIPEDCDALIIVGAHYDLDLRETTILQACWRYRGRLLVLLDPDARTPNLASVLTEAGITPQDDRVLRTIGLPVSIGNAPTIGVFQDVTAQFLATSEITKRLVGAEILLPKPTQSLKLVDVKDAAVHPLMQAAEAYWGEMDYHYDQNKGVRYDEGRDVGQPVYVAASADRGGTQDDEVKIQSSKLIVVGNSQFAMDASLNQSGLDFLASALNSMLDRGSLTGIAPKVPQYFTLNLTDAQMGGIALYTMILIPGAAALLGIIAWWRRRS